MSHTYIHHNGAVLRVVITRKMTDGDKTYYETLVHPVHDHMFEAHPWLETLTSIVLDRVESSSWFQAEIAHWRMKRKWTL